MKRFVVACAVLGLVTSPFVACKSSDADNNTGNGVNDLHVACEQRTSWPKDNQDCNTCKTGVLNAHCDCSALKDYSGECLDQQNAWKAACDDATDQCVINCIDDCACLDGCYANKAACKKAADARDGCMTAFCGQFCKSSN